jgi:PPM family protein phosphatase
MRLEIFQHSLIGGRKNNQDRLAYAYTKDALLMVVADGMGGHAAGEVAAELAVGIFTERFKQQARPILQDPTGFLRNAFISAHSAIVNYARQRNLPDCPRTTCVACIVQGNTARWGHAGDSRLYLLRKGRQYKRTRDHSRVQRLVDAGLIREDEALTHPDRNRIFSCLGGNQLPSVSLSNPTELKPGDLMLLCSDGFWGVLTTTEIEAGLADEAMSTALPRLINRALANGGERGDNLSVLALAWPGPVKSDLEYIDSAVTMPLNMITLPNQTGPGEKADGDLSDEEIERTIAEIQAAIQKYSRDANGE